MISLLPSLTTLALLGTVTFHTDTPPPPDLLASSLATSSKAMEDPASVVAAFHQALAAGDSVAVVRLLHEEVLIFEQGQAENLEEYRSHHLAADIRFARQTTRHVLDSRSTIAGDVAVLTARTHVTGRVGDREINSHGVETMVLARTNEGWKIRHIHWSSR